MAYVFKNQLTENIGEDGGTSSNVDMTGVDVIYLFIAYQGTIASVNDSQSNTYTLVASISAALNLYKCENPIVNSTHNFQIGGTDIFATIGAFGFSGAATNPADQVSTANTFGNSIQPGSVTPLEDNELIFSAVRFNAATGSTPTVDSSFISPAFFADISAAGFGLAVSYLIQTSAAAVNPTFSWTNSVTVDAMIHTFKAAADQNVVLMGDGLT